MLHTIANATITMTTSGVDVIATIVCYGGHVFGDGALEKEVTCSCDSTYAGLEQQYGLSDCVPGKCMCI